MLDNVIFGYDNLDNIFKHTYKPSIGLKSSP